MTPAADLPAEGREKLEQKVVDFERIDEAGLKEGQWDVVFVACVKFLVQFLLINARVHRLCGRRMGTTAKAAGSSDNFTKIDKECV